MDVSNNFNRSNNQAASGLNTAGASGANFNAELDRFSRGSGESQNSQLSELLYAPLDACIMGMTLAAQNSVNFIKSHGFEGDEEDPDKMGKPIMIQFKLKRPGGAMGMLDNNTKVTIPFLTLVHIPFLRLEKVVVDFTIKLNSVRSQTVTGSRARVNMSTEGEEHGQDQDWDVSTNMVGLTSTRLDSQNGNEIKKEYSLQCVITAVQDALPVGMEKLLDILEQEIKDTSNDANAGAMTGKMMEAMQGPDLGTVEGMSTFETGGE